VGYAMYTNDSESRVMEVVKVLCAAGVNMNTVCSDKDATPLYMAALNGYSDVVKLLLEAKANVNTTRENDTTPLFIAAKLGHIEVVKALLAAKADVNIARADGMTPLKIARKKGFDEIVKILLEAQPKLPPHLSLFGQTAASVREEKELNFWHKDALKELKKYGLTADMLLNRNENGHEFDSEHSWALCKLVLERHATIQEALAMIDGLNNKQAEGIKKGLTREPVVGEMREAGRSSSRPRP
jgi:ankyrin repeat protein